jgi:hypothetical protein
VQITGHESFVLRLPREYNCEKGHLLNNDSEKQKKSYFTSMYLSIIALQTLTEFVVQT